MQINTSSFLETKIEDKFYVLKSENDGKKNKNLKKEIDTSFIQFHFVSEGQAIFSFNNGAYKMSVNKGKYIVLYNPIKNLPLNAVVSPKSNVLSVLISIKKFHSLFSQEAEQISFLSDENIDKKYYKDHVFTPSMAVVLSQILQHQPNTLMSRLYLKGKVYELLSLYFNPSEATDIAECPFLVDEENVRKIRNAKKIMLARMTAPPSLTELADEIGLSLKKLKEGFKQLYGSTVYQFVLDHKMNHARQLLGTGSHNVNEVAIQLGYSNSSHFIEAFKKKFGTTPKKYLLSVS